MAATLDDIGKALAAADAAGAVDDAKALAKLYNHRKIEMQIENDPISQGARNFAKDMPWYQQGAAGAGKAVADIGLGARQLTGNASQQEVDETKQRDAALMNTGAGMTGNIIGNVGMAVAPGLGAVGAGRLLGQQGLQAAGRYALASPATLGGIATQGGMGAVQAGLQPVPTGDSRTGNATIGAIGGGLIPAAGMAIKGGAAALEPMYESGRQSIMGRTLRRVAGGDGEAQAAEAALRNAGELVTGSAPTAGQSANNAGIAALERTAFATEPGVTVPVANRLRDQNQARVDALRNLADPGLKKFAEGAREQAAAPLYAKAYANGIDPAGLGVQPELTAALGDLAKRPAVQAAIKEAEVKAANEGADLGGDILGSVTGLHYVKRALDDQMANAAPDDLRILKAVQEKLLGTVDQLSPEYGAARQAYAAASRPVNQIDTASEIAKKSIRPLDDTMMPGAYARALSDDTARSATGFNKATLANTMEPQQLAALNAIKDDLARAEFAKNAGRGVGSDTVQKMAYHNLMQQSGISGLPNLLSRPVQLAEYLSRTVYSSADREMAKKLAEALLDPKATAALMRQGMPSPTAEKLAAALRASAPLGSGAAVGLLDAR